MLFTLFHIYFDIIGFISIVYHSFLFSNYTQILQYNFYKIESNFWSKRFDPDIYIFILLIIELY